MNLHQPLSDEEIEELDLILMNQPDDIDSMSVSMLDGFLTAVVSGPNSIMPSIWMPWVWDFEQGKTNRVLTPSTLPSVFMNWYFGR